MIILPLHKPLNRRHFPAVTAALVLINCLIFGVFQSGDRDVEESAAHHYAASGLVKTEWDWLKEAAAPAEQDLWQAKQTLQDWRDQNVPELAIAYYQAQLIEALPGFLEDAHAGRFADREEEAWQSWAAQRQRYESILEDSFSRTFSLKQHAPTLTTLFSHMFLHGSLMHLLGNMLFLCLLGLLVEGALGRGLFLTSYLLTGLAAAGFTLAVNWGGAGAMLGASGAIAGLMGLFAVIYGRRRVRFFYWFFVYFDYIRAPAIVLLPAWLGWELLQFVVNQGSNVAYEAHIGGLLAGSLLGLGIQQLGAVREDFLNEEEHRDRDRDQLKKAQRAVTELKPQQAKLLLRPLIEAHPEDLDVVKIWLAACRLTANDPERHQVMAHLLSLPGESEAQQQFIIESFHDYRRDGQIRLKPSQLCELAVRFARWGALDEAQQWLSIVLTRKPGATKLPSACLMLGRRLHRAGRFEAARPWLEATERLSSRAAEREAARTLMEQ